MLPALPAIGSSYGVSSIALQQILTIFIFGMFFGEIVLGPLSDCFGRKPVILLSSCIFLVGSLICMFASTYEWLLFGRLVQGAGAAGPKITIRAMLRDLYSGRQLAQVFSMIYTLFIFVPMIAPLVGQGISKLAGWQGIFQFLFFFAAAVTLLFAYTQKETLALEHRSSIRIGFMIRTGFKVFTHQKIFLLTLVLGFLFGIKLTYLSTAQQIFADYYQITDLFPLVFALLASAIGLAFFSNARLVMRFGGERLCGYALYLLVAMSLVLLIATVMNNSVPPFSIFVICFYGMFFGLGLLWGNLSALAMDYLGEVAGLGATLISAGSSLVSFFIASVVGQFYGPEFTIIAGCFLLIALAAFLCFFAAIRSNHVHTISRYQI